MRVLGAYDVREAFGRMCFGDEPSPLLSMQRVGGVMRAGVGAAEQMLWFSDETRGGER